MSKKNEFPFQQKITDLILSVGATPADRSTYKYQLQTSCGMLFIQPYRDWIATRFDEPARVPRDITINRYSGKWNFHPASPDQSWVDFFKQQLAVIRAKGELE